MITYIIIGAGCFGLYTALNIRKIDKTGIIKILDVDKNNSATVNGGNGITTERIIPDDIFNAISFDKYKTPIYLNKINIEWLIIHGINNLFNNNKQKIFDLTGESNEYHKFNYWEKKYDLCKKNNIEIIDNVYIKDYSIKDDKIYLDNYICDKLIIATGANLSLIPKCLHSYISIFSGIAVTIRVKNVPKKFYFAHDIFITPYKDDKVVITGLLQLGDDIEINKKKLSKYIKNNKEIKKLGLISIERMWEGKRAMTYDTMPFYTKINKNVYWISGGSYLGTHSASIFGKHLANYIINNKPVNVNNDFFNLSRLKNIRLKYYIILIYIILCCLIIFVY